MHVHIVKEGAFVFKGDRLTKCFTLALRSRYGPECAGHLKRPRQGLPSSRHGRGRDDCGQPPLSCMVVISCDRDWLMSLPEEIWLLIKDWKWEQNPVFEEFSMNIPTFGAIPRCIKSRGGHCLCLLKPEFRCKGKRASVPILGPVQER